MTLEEKTSAAQIANEAGMSARPGFYSGRGARSCDLNDKVLEKIYQAIQKNHGEEVAKRYAQMVADTPRLSATDFLLNLYRLESHGWQWDKKMLGKEKGIYPEDEGSALGTIASVLGGMDEVDETSSIRHQFLKRHGIKIPYTERASNNYFSNEIREY